MAAATRNTDPPPSPPPPPPSLIYTRGRRLYVPRSSLSDKLPFDWPTAIRYEQISYVNPIRPFPSPLLRRAFKMLTFSPLQKSLFLQRIDLETNLSSSHVLSFSLSLYIFIYIYLTPFTKFARVNGLKLSGVGHRAKVSRQRQRRPTRADQIFPRDLTACVPRPFVKVASLFTKCCLPSRRLFFRKS